LKRAPAPIHPSRWYATLAVLACAASLQALVLPRWPRAMDLSAASIETSLRGSGFRPVPLKPLPSRRSFDLASSKVLGYELDGGDELRLVDVTVRERLKFDGNMITGDQPKLRLEAAQITPQPPFSSSGRINGRPARQTCLVPGMQGSAAFAVTQEQLWVPVDTLAREDAKASLLRLIGLGSKRSYRCSLITLRAGPDRLLPDARWQRLLRVLRPVLERGVVPPSAQSPHPLPSSADSRHG